MGKEHSATSRSGSGPLTSGHPHAALRRRRLWRNPMRRATRDQLPRSSGAEHDGVVVKAAMSAWTYDQ
jgi:hypothetical protein